MKLYCFAYSACVVLIKKLRFLLQTNKMLFVFKFCVTLITYKFKFSAVNIKTLCYWNCALFKSILFLVPASLDQTAKVYNCGLK